MNKTNRFLISLLLPLILISITGLMWAFLPEVFLLSPSSLSTCYLLVLLVILFFYFHIRTVRSHTKTNLLICTLLMMVFLLLRGARYTSFRDLEWVMRYLWYLYYIPCLLIPCFVMRASLYVGIPTRERLPKRYLLPFAVSSVLILAVLTNDLHQLVFRLNPGFLHHWIDRYDYGILYYVVYTWIAVLLLFSFAVLIRKCRISECRRYFWVPLIPIAVGTLWLTLIPLGLAPSIAGHLFIEFPDAFCFTIAWSWLCCIHIGLVPANEAYADLFHISHIGALITDRNRNIVYTSADANTRTDPLESSGDLLIRHKPIPGGYVYWQSDVSSLNRMNAQLSAIRQELQEEADLLRIENELKETMVSIREKNNVYDAIAVRVLPQTRKVSELAALAVQKPKPERRELRCICIYGSYIKRMSNLMLLAAQQPIIPETELALAFSESLRQVSKLDIVSDLYIPRSENTYTAASAIDAYEQFQRCLETCLPGLTAVSVTIKDSFCRLTFEGDLPACLPDGPNGSSSEYDDDALFVRIPLTEGGILS